MAKRIVYPPIEQTIARAWGEVIGDIEAGHVPPTVEDFSGLHSYVDANYYGGAFEVGFDGSDEAFDYWNRVQDEIDARLRASLHFQLERRP